MGLFTGNVQGSDEGSARVRRLRDEIQRVIEREYSFAGKYQELAASFQAVIPDAQQRHEAVLQALSATLKLNREEIILAFGQQQEELGLLEAAVEELFAELGAKSSAIPRQAQAGTGQAPASQGTAAQKHCPKCGERITLERDKNRLICYSCTYEESLGGTAVAAPEPERPAAAPAAAGSELQKKCPMCNGQMHFHAHDGRWLCYTCAHEEVQEGGQARGEQAGAPGPASTPSFTVPLAAMVSEDSRKPLVKAKPQSPAQPMGRNKTCPVCHKKMDWHGHEKVWRCFFCNHKTRY